MKRLNKKATCEKFHSLNVNSKRGQFFILAAVIIAVAVAGLMVVYNTVYVEDSQQKVYRYSDQLDQETGAVVDYALFSGENKVSDFVNQSIQSIQTSYPGLDVFACYSGSVAYELVCNNYGGNVLFVTTTTNSNPVVIGVGEIPGGAYIGGIGGTIQVYSPTTEVITLSPQDAALFVRVNGSTTFLTLDLTKAVASNQYYFILRANTSSGSTDVAST